MQKLPKYKPTKAVQDASEMGKVPPQAVELEEAVLGAMMLEKDAALDVLDVLRIESFYVESHQLIFKALGLLASQQKPIDILTVTEELRKSGDLDKVGGPFYISQLTSRVGSAAHVEYHAHIIAQKYIQRELIRVSSEIQSKAYDPSVDVQDLLDFSETQLFEIANGNIKSQTEIIKDVVKDSIRSIEEASKRADGMSGVPSGFNSLDKVTSGWQRSDLVIIAARPSMGKTAFVLSMARNMAVTHNMGVVVFSLEMANVQLVNRLIAAETELSSEKIRNGKLEDYEWEQLEHKIGPLQASPLFVDDTPAISIFELRAKLRRISSQHKLDIVIIDYLQLMTGTAETKGNREQEVSMISRGLKALAKEMNVPVLALSQLNRSVEMRAGDKRPQLSDLRESGAIEQDADIVLFIHRPEKYGITEDAEGNSTKGLAEIIIAKHRNGEVTDVNLRWRAELAKFEDWENDALANISADDAGDDMGGVVMSSKMNDDIYADANKVFSDKSERDTNAPF